MADVDVKDFDAEDVDVKPVFEKTENRGQQLFVKDTSASADADLRFGIPKDDGNTVWKFVHKKEFEKHIGRPLHEQDFGTESPFNIIVQGGRSDYAVPGQLHNTFKEKKYVDQIRRAEETMAELRAPLNRLTPESQGPMKNSRGEVVFGKNGKPLQARELSGEDRRYDTPGGQRERNYAYGPGVSSEAAGERLPDIVFETTDNQMIGIYRVTNDDFSGLDIHQMKNKAKENLGVGIKNIYLRSQSGILQNVENLERDGKNIQKRLNSYLRDVEYGKDVPQLMMHYGQRFWPAKTVLTRQPEGDHARRLELGPNATPPNGYGQNLAVLVKDKDHFYPAEYYSKNKADFHEIMESLEQSVNKNGSKEVNLFKGSWYRDGCFDEISKRTQIQSQILVAVGEGENIRLEPIDRIVTGDIDRSFPADKRYAAKVTLGEHPRPTGVYQNMAVMDPRDYSKAVLDTLDEVKSKLKPSYMKASPERGNTRVKMEPGSHDAYSSHSRNFDPRSKGRDASSLGR